MRTASAKQKGRRLQQQVAAELREVFNASEADIKSTPMGTQGEDIWLSSQIRLIFPYSVECKNVEKLNVWKAWEQAVSNTEQATMKPLLVISKNRSETLVVLRLEDFLLLYK